MFFWKNNYVIIKVELKPTLLSISGMCHTNVETAFSRGKHGEASARRGGWIAVTRMFVSTGGSLDVYRKIPEHVLGRIAVAVSILASV